MSERPTPPQQDTEDLKHPQSQFQRPEDVPNLSPLAANEQVQEKVLQPDQNEVSLENLGISAAIEKMSSDVERWSKELIKWAESDDDLKRFLACGAMSKKPELFSEQIAILSHDESTLVRGEAMVAIGRNIDLFDRLSSEGGDAYYRRIKRGHHIIAASEKTRRGKPLTTEDLLYLFDEVDNQADRVIELQQHWIGSPDTRRLFEEEATSEVTAIRLHATKIVAKYPAHYKALLTTLAQDEDPEIRKIATQAIGTHPDFSQSQRIQVGSRQVSLHDEAPTK